MCVFSISCALGRMAGWQCVIDVFSLGTLIRHVFHVLGMASPFICTLSPLRCSGPKEKDSCGLGRADFPLKSRCGHSKKYFFFFLVRKYSNVCLVVSLILQSAAPLPSVDLTSATCRALLLMPRNPPCVRDVFPECPYGLDGSKVRCCKVCLLLSSCEVVNI